MSGRVVAVLAGWEHPVARLLSPRFDLAAVCDLLSREVRLIDGRIGCLQTVLNTGLDPSQFGAADEREACREMAALTTERRVLHHTRLAVHLLMQDTDESRGLVDAALASAGAPVVKTCQACGRTYSCEEFFALSVPVGGSWGRLGLNYRQCACLNTLALPTEMPTEMPTEETQS